MQHPIQRLHFCSATSRVYAATSNVIHVFDSSGKLLSTWTAPVPPPQNQRGVSATSATPEVETPAPKNKKRKMDDKSTSRLLRLADVTLSGCNNAVTKLSTTQNGDHLIVTTNEDKSIRVFSTENGKLECLSCRALPKRVGDFALVDNDTTIIAGDKHGDVFALPLLTASSATDTPPSPRTLHLSRDTAEREALAAIKRQRTEIDYNLPFKHKFILGHVSMLLSILPVTIGNKSWILTGDRDEHIRVTRYPQTFVIDRFCLGHEAFVSQMLVPTWDQEQLISGGGDTYLLTWNWKDGTINQKIDLRDHVNKTLAGQESKTENKISQEFEIGVSGLWELPNIRGILVGVEAVPALFLFKYNQDGSCLKYSSTLQLDGNLLNVAIVGGEANRILVSIDPSTAEHSLVTAHEVDQSGQWSKVKDDPVVKSVESAVTMVNVPEHLVPAVKTGVLYTVRLLRKEVAAVAGERTMDVEQE